ncbi:hypothetical protein WJX82_001148 [Trebouxia sp. C0006]
MRSIQCQHAGHTAAGTVSTSWLHIPHCARRSLLRSSALPHVSKTPARLLSLYPNIKADSTEQSREQSVKDSSKAGQPDRRGLLAGSAVLLGAGGFLATRSGKGAPSFASLEKGSIDLDTALANGKPTIIEFYAAWCGICRELLPVSAQVQSSFKNSVNFVALNIDNTKWTDEVSQYRVRGVPHFVFLDRHGKQQAAAVGRVPRQMLEDNVRALAAGAKMPFAHANGTTSTPDNAAGTALKQVMPRDHA